MSGGVASNHYIQKALTIITETTGLRLLCPPAKFCTDNGVMIAWWGHWQDHWFENKHIFPVKCFWSCFLIRNGVELLREGKGILSPEVDVRYEPK